MKPSLFIFLLFLSVGCASTKITKEAHNEKDSTHISVQTIYIERIDTAYITLPSFSESVSTKDTTSILENPFAYSKASFLRGVGLIHSLKTKSVKTDVQVVYRECIRDSIIYRDRDVFIEKPIIVEKPLSKFFKVQIIGFWALLFIFFLYFKLRI